MKEINIFCFGFGQVAKNFIKKINNEGASFKLTTTSRENSQKKTFENIHYESFQFSEKSVTMSFLVISGFSASLHKLRCECA